jgi:hypothetical protein
MQTTRLILWCLALGQAAAFLPSPHTLRPRTAMAAAGDKPDLPFFARASSSAVQKQDASPPSTTATTKSLDQEVDELVAEEIEKMKKASKLKGANGVEFAPWMGMTEQDEAQIRVLMRERAEARRRRKEQEQSVSGNLYLDSQAQELSGTGLKYKVIDTNTVELEWATKTEANTKGFLVKRRPAKTQSFDTIATFNTWSPLLSKGANGGIYRFIDNNAGPGGWVYRISECDNYGAESDLCQCLVEVQTQEEQKAGLIAGVGIAVIAVAAAMAGLFLDPYAG